MEWQHYTRIKSSMSYIEELLKDMEESVSGKRKIYKSVYNDLSKEQLIHIKKKLRNIKNLLAHAKKDFNLEHNRFTLSHIINVDCNYIWETIEELWSYKLEKSSGKINSKEKKEKLDAILKELLNYSTQIKNLVGK